MVDTGAEPGQTHEENDEIVSAYPGGFIFSNDNPVGVLTFRRNRRYVLALEVVGPAGLTKSVWANFNRGERKDDEVKATGLSWLPVIGERGFTVTRDNGASTYFSRSKTWEPEELVSLGLSFGGSIKPTSILIIHRRFIRTWGPPSYVFGGDEHEPSPWFRSVINQRGVAFLPDWVPVLWREAYGDLITPAIGAGKEVFEISSSQDQWKELIGKLIRDGKLTQ